MLSATKLTYIYFLGLLIFGLGFHSVQKIGKHYHAWEYVEAPPKKPKRSSANTTPTNIVNTVNTNGSKDNKSATAISLPSSNNMTGLK
jgi:hypothetical protein